MLNPYMNVKYLSTGLLIFKGAKEITSSNREEKETSQSAAANWDIFWKTALDDRYVVEETFWHRIKRFFKRAGGVELAYRIVQKEAGDIEGKALLDAGCGIGDNSLRMGGCNSFVILMDTSLAALEFARMRAEAKGVAVICIQGSLFNLPFKEGSFDFVFNAGVLDHFTPGFRKKALEEMIRAAKTGGKCVVITNDIRSLIHPVAMRQARKKGRWHFGFKDALKSLKSEMQMEEGRHIVREYSRGFISQFEFLHYFFNTKGILRKLFLRIFYLLSFPLSLLNHFPGQYMVTVIEKRAGDDHDAK